MADLLIPENVDLEGYQKAPDLFEKIIAEDVGKILIRPPVDGIAVSFSNTRTKSESWFVLTLDQIIQVLSDLRENRDVIVNKAGNPSTYVETEWRSIFRKYLTDEVAKTIGGTQTLPAFELISKIVHFSGPEASTKRKYLELNLDAIALERAEEALTSWKNTSEKHAQKTKVQTDFLKDGENVIFYGAPGTGKSNRVEKKIREAGKRPFRTVFHPDLQNSDFFGCLKPQMDGDNVRYGFSPGPFMQALAEAYRTPGEPVYLVIEELNRAAAAAVFGDLFLLLDRDDDGKGEYDVSFPSPECEEWFEDKTGTPLETLLLPSNIFIYATMNSADQGVYPIDTAFRRRWRQEYLPLDYEKGPDGDVAYVNAKGTRHSLTWRDFDKLLNSHLTSSQTLNIAEDRLLGQWFVKKKELDGKGIPEKVLLYLWDDLLRHDGREHVFDSGTNGKVKTYGDLVIEAAEGRRFLSDSFLGKLNTASESGADQPEEPGDDAL